MLIREQLMNYPFKEKFVMKITVNDGHSHKSEEVQFNTSDELEEYNTKINQLYPYHEKLQEEWKYLFSGYWELESLEMYEHTRDGKIFRLRRMG